MVHKYLIFSSDISYAFESDLRSIIEVKFNCHNLNVGTGALRLSCTDVYLVCVYSYSSNRLQGPTFNTNSFTGASMPILMAIVSTG